jgi:hypothetical protein
VKLGLLTLRDLRRKCLKEYLVGDKRKLHNEELHNLYSSPITMVKLGKIRRAGHVACIGRREMRKKFGWKA